MAPINGRFVFEWDLGDEWFRWTGLPFVFAMWTAGPNVDIDGLSQAFGEARDRGLRLLVEIARREAPTLPISQEECLSYFQDALVFRLGPRQREGLSQFRNLAVRHGLVPEEARFAFDD